MNGMRIPELVFALSGIFILVSTFMIYQAQDFTLWSAAKILYAIGLVLVLKYS